MKKNDVASVYVAYEDKRGGKNRPVLIIEDNNDSVTFYKITSKYGNKSNAIKRNYFSIDDWKLVGLNKRSWIDLNKIKSITKNNNIANFKKIGELTINDSLRLYEFLNKKGLHKNSIESEVIKDLYKTTRNKNYNNLEAIYYSNQPITDKFSKGDEIEKFYSKHKKEIDDCISELAKDTGIPKKKILEDNTKQEICKLAYDLRFLNLIKKIENKDIAHRTYLSEISVEKNDLEID